MGFAAMARMLGLARPAAAARLPQAVRPLTFMKPGSRPYTLESALHFDPASSRGITTRFKLCSSVAVMGGKFGDETKGATTDALARWMRNVVVIRFNGGPNAGHGVVHADIMHNHKQVPSGMENNGVFGFLSSGMHLNPAALFEEISTLESMGVQSFRNRFWVSPDCPIILGAFGGHPGAHDGINRLIETARGAGNVGTTGEGLGELARDIAGCDLDFERNFDWIKPGITPSGDRGDRVIYVRDLLERDVLYQKLSVILPARESLAQALLESGGNSAYYHEQSFDDEVNLSHLLAMGAALRPYLKCAPGENVNNPRLLSDIEIIRGFERAGKARVFEGAQGFLLDPEFGPWPYVTKTRTGFASAAQSTGLTPKELGVKLALVGIYEHRHGKGPLPTLQTSPEYAPLVDSTATNPWPAGFTVGNFDLLSYLYMIEHQKPDAVGLTRIDRLDKFPVLRVCVGYKFKPREGELSAKKAILALAKQAGEQRARRTGIAEDENYYTNMLTDESGNLRQEVVANETMDEITLQRYVPVAEILERCTPIYKDFTGWNTSTARVQNFADCPPNLQRLIRWLEDVSGVPIVLGTFGDKPEDRIPFEKTAV